MKSLRKRFLRNCHWITTRFVYAYISICPTPVTHPCSVYIPFLVSVCGMPSDYDEVCMHIYPPAHTSLHCRIHIPPLPWHYIYTLVSIRGMTCCDTPSTYCRSYYTCPSLLIHIHPLTHLHPLTYPPSHTSPPPHLTTRTMNKKATTNPSNISDSLVANTMVSKS